MLKVYKKEDNNPTLFNRLSTVIFDIEPQHFQFTDNINEADIVPCLYREELKDSVINYFSQLGYKGPIVLLSVFHTGPGFIHNDNDPLKIFYEQHFSKVILVHTNLKEKQCNLYFDMMWERHRLYFNEYKKYDLKHKVWTYESTGKMYRLKPIGLNTKKPIKHFLAPMRLYNNANCNIRHILADLLKKHIDKGYLSDLAGGEYLHPQENNATIHSHFTSEEMTYAGGTWYPVHNSYYQTSIASIYGETLTVGSDVTGLTEKTLDPLIKGHFIIPFGYSGFVQDLINEYNIQLPDWIDYSYDSVINDERRRLYYIKEVKRFLKQNLERLVYYYNRDKHMLEHNRSLFFTCKQQTIGDKIQKMLEE